MATEPTVDPALATYLTTNRDFVAPAVDAAILSLDICDGSDVVDIGTGAGGAIAPLALAVGPSGRVTAIDRNPAALTLAEAAAEAAAVLDRVALRCADAVTALAESAGTFDAVWAGDVVWRGNIADPAHLVGSMAAAARPGGTVALFTSGYYRATFLPGHSRLERLLLTASELRWGQPRSGPTHHERHVTWMLATGLADVSLRAFPRVAFPIPSDHDARAYLERTVWPELLASASACGRTAAMTDEEIGEARALLTPGSDRYVLDEPGSFVLHPTVLVTGRA